MEKYIPFSMHKLRKRNTETVVENNVVFLKTIKREGTLQVGPSQKFYTNS